MSEQNREDDRPDEGEYSDPTAPAPDPQWTQPLDGTPPPPPLAPHHGQESPPYGAPPPGPSPYPQPEAPQDPYAQPAPYAPSGAAPYGDPSSPYGAPPAAYYQQAPSQQNTSALVLTILSGIGVFSCCGVTIPALIFGIVALVKQSTEPVQSAKLAKWGWIAFAAGFALAIIGFVLYVAGMIALAPEFADPGI